VKREPNAETRTQAMIQIPLQVPDAERHQRPLVLETTKLPLNRSARAIGRAGELCLASTFLPERHLR